ncbi:hypothetical protein C8R43DRAFT_958907 [Mycena crocata]|nr:hypothetical protein C8R43DRAFT_958907 [Mycena crocata]
MLNFLETFRDKRARFPSRTRGESSSELWLQYPISPNIWCSSTSPPPRCFPWRPGAALKCHAIPHRTGTCFLFEAFGIMRPGLQKHSELIRLFYRTMTYLAFGTSLRTGNQFSQAPRAPLPECLINGCPPLAELKVHAELSGWLEPAPSPTAARPPSAFPPQQELQLVVQTAAKRQSRRGWAHLRRADGEVCRGVRTGGSSVSLPESAGDGESGDAIKKLYIQGGVRGL